MLRPHGCAVYLLAPSTCSSGHTFILSFSLASLSSLSLWYNLLSVFRAGESGPGEPEHHHEWKWNERLFIFKSCLISLIIKVVLDTLRVIFVGTGRVRNSRETVSWEKCGKNFLFQLSKSSFLLTCNCRVRSRFEWTVICWDKKLLTKRPNERISKESD